MRIKNLVGKKFGRLTVVEISGRTNRQQVTWRCLCECGNYTVVSNTGLQSGNTKSCGCLKHDILIRRNKKGSDPDKKTRLYRIWQRMKYRCENEQSSDYKYYGGKGVSVCENWKNDFQSFKKWALINGYNDDLTIDRINVNGNYEPSNCKWATMAQQCINTTKNHFITYKGETHTLSEWSKKFKMDGSKIRYRLNHNWPLDKIFSTH